MSINWLKHNNFEFHHLQKDFFHENNSNQMLEVSLFYFYYFSALNSAFVASVVIFLSKTELSINPKISDLSTKSFSFIFILRISPLNLL